MKAWTMFWWAIAGAVILLLASLAHGHDPYVGIVNAKGQSCCGGQDCVPAAHGQVRDTGGGYEFLSDRGEWTPVDEVNVVRDASPDGQPHLCLWRVDGEQRARCLILPAVM